MDTNDLMKQIKEAAKVIEVTFGPKGRSVFVVPANGNPFFTRDGKTVADYLKETPGSKLLKDACNTTVARAGDGTTTTAILCASLIEQGIDPTPYEKDVLKFIESKAGLIPDEEDTMQLARYISHDEELGKVVGEVVWEIGRFGQVRTEVSGDKLDYRVDAGYDTGAGPYMTSLSLSPGWESPAFTKEDNYMTLHEPYIAIIGAELGKDPSMLGKIMRRYTEEVRHEFPITRPLVIIASSLTDTSANLAYNTLKEGGPIPGRIGNAKLPIFVIQAPRIGGHNNPRFGFIMEQMMEDIKVLTGCDEVYTPSNVSRKVANKEFLGKFGIAKEIILREESCRIVGGGGNPVEIDERLEEMMVGKKNDIILQTRISMMMGKSAVISFPHNLYAENQNLNLRAEDAVLACQQAFDNGFVVGGRSIWEDLATNFPDLDGPFRDIAKKLPGTKSLDPTNVLKAAIQSAFALARQVLNCEKITGNGI